MDRRRALKNIGLGAGFMIATPTVLSILQSCTSEPVFTPVFLGQGEGHALRRLVDLVIPSDSEIPGAADLGVHEFIDSFWNDVVPEESQAQVKMAFGIFSEQFTATFNKEMTTGKAKEFDQMLSKYLTISKDEQEAYDEKMGDFFQAYATDKSVKPDADAACNMLLSQVRGMTIWGWKNTEQIGEQVLAYDPIPGSQVGCLPLSEATGGKAYSL